MDIKVSYTISAPVSRVFEAIVDPDMVKQWLAGLSEFRFTGSQDREIGSRFVQVWDESGDLYELVGKIVDYEQNERYSIELIGKGISVKVDYALKEDGELTQITQQTHVAYTGLIRVLSKLTRRFTVKSYKKTLDENYQKLAILLAG